MKRLTVIAVLSLAAAVLATTPALGAGVAKSTTSSKVTPKRDKTRPYKFKTTGTVKFPSAFCAPGRTGTNCLPLNCPNGVTNAAYCTRPTIAQVCTGKVRIVFKQGTKTRSSKTVNLRSNCTYTSTVTIRQRARVLRVSVRFAGNTLLAASNASTKSVRSG